MKISHLSLSGKTTALIVSFWQQQEGKLHSPADVTETVGGWLIQSARRCTLPILIVSLPPRMAVPSQDAPLMAELPSSCGARSILSGHRCSSSSTQRGPHEALQ